MALRLVGEVALDGSGFERGLNRLSTGAVAGFRNTLASAFGGIAIGQLVKGTVEWASKLNDVSDALGVNVEWLQKMQNGAKLAGGDIEDIEKMILEINKSRQQALLEPGGKSAQVFGRAGLTSADVRTLNTQEFVQRFIESFKNGVTAQGAIDIREVGGRSANHLLAAFGTQFASGTPVLAASLIQKLDDIGDQFTNLATTLKVVLAPTILYITGLLVQLANKFGQLGPGLGASWDAFWKGVEKNRTGTVPIRERFDTSVGAAVRAFQHGVVSAEADQQDLADQLEIALKAAASAKKARQEASPDFDLGAMKKAKAMKEPATDALISVGNFLGAGQPAIQAIAEQHLQVARETLAVQKEIKNEFAELDKIVAEIKAENAKVDWPD